MEIRDDHVEWAVVDRLRKMLESPPPTQFNVTQTYALFVPILCWTLQRARAREPGEIGELASSVLKKLQSDPIEQTPWSIPTGCADAHVGIGPFPEFANRTAAQFLISLRHAVAHGDARNVRPFHRRRNGGTELSGFEFDCEERNRERKIIWTGTITLLEADMRRIGLALADRFCKALRRHSENRRDGHFCSDAAHGVVEKAA